MHHNAVAIKLPTFWAQQPKVWFLQAEAQFHIHKITDDTRPQNETTQEKKETYMDDTRDHDQTERKANCITNIYGFKERCRLL